MGGTLIAISERGLDRVGNIRAFLIGGLAPGTFAIKRKGQFDVTDAALLPSGDLLILGDGELLVEVFFGFHKRACSFEALRNA
jgi:hypothetical protein